MRVWIKKKFILLAISAFFCEISFCQYQGGVGRGDRVSIYFLGHSKGGVGKGDATNLSSVIRIGEIGCTLLTSIQGPTSGCLPIEIIGVGSGGIGDYTFLWDGGNSVNTALNTVLTLSLIHI